MKKTIILTFLTLFTFFIQADEQRYIFINSDPIRAVVYRNDVSTDIKTPCVFIGKEIESLKITLVKEGYKPYTISQREIRDVVKGSKKIDVSLTPISFDIFFPERTKYKIGPTLVEGPVYVEKLKSGKYDLFVDNDKIKFSKASEFLPFEVGVGTAFGISLGTMIATIALSEYFNYYQHYEASNELEKYHYQNMTTNMDYVKFATIGTSVLFGAILIGLVVADSVTTYQSNKKALAVSNKTPTTQENIFYQSSLQFLSLGEIDKSTQILESIVSLYPNSRMIPTVYYQIGQNYYIMKEYEKAQNYWNVFIRDFPVIEYYDYVIKNLSEIHIQKDEPKIALNYLDKILYTNDTLLNKEQVISLKGQINFKLYQTDSNEEYLINCENNFLSLINQFYNSSRIDSYVLQLIKLYKLSKNDDKLEKLKTIIKELDIDDVMKKNIEQLF